MALQMSEAEEMVKICGDAGVRLGIGHQYRFHPYFVHAADLVVGGALGRIRRARANIKDSVANNGPHLVDTLRFVLGDRPARYVSADFERTGDTMNRGVPVESAARGEITFEDGLVAEAKLGDASKTFFDIEVEGEVATLKVNLEGVWLDGRQVLHFDSAWYDCRRRQFTEFVHWACGRSASYAANAATSARTTELVLAMYESGRTKSQVELPLQFKGDIIREYWGAADLKGKGQSAAGRIPSDPHLAMDGGKRAVVAWPPQYPHIGVGEGMGLARVLLSRQLGCSGGSEVSALEREFAAAYGAPRAVASTSGTAAIHVAVAAVDPEPCDEIITTPMSDMGTVIPILMANCIPVFADIDPVTGNLTADTIRQKITARTRAVIVVHLLGRPAEMGPIQELLRTEGIPLIEDCAQAHLAEYRGKKVGTFGDLGCFSLQQSKQITCGDGGLTIVNREDMIERASLFVDKGRSRTAGRSHKFLAANYRMTELQGAVARAQLEKCADLIGARRAAAAALSAKLSQKPGIVVPQTAPDTQSSWWLYNFLIEETTLGVTADEFCEGLCAEGVPAMRQYLERPLFEEEMIAKRRTFGESGYPLSAVNYTPPKRKDLPGLDEFFRRQIILAWNSRLKPANTDGVAEAVDKLLRALGHRPDASARDPRRLAPLGNH